MYRFVKVRGQGHQCRRLPRVQGLWSANTSLARFQEAGMIGVLRTRQAVIEHAKWACSRGVRG